jgi:hypothetical protein
VPISSALTYVRGLLDALPMPYPTAPLVCTVRPPEPFTDPGPIPTCYLWPSDFDESRQDTSRNQGPGTSSGFKIITHQMGGWVRWSGADGGTGLLFPAMVDAICAALRTAYPMPADVTDPYTGDGSQISNVGEVLRGRINVMPVPDQQNNQYEALLLMPVIEVIQA